SPVTVREVVDVAIPDPAASVTLSVPTRWTIEAVDAAGIAVTGCTGLHTTTVRCLNLGVGGRSRCRCRASERQARCSTSVPWGWVAVCATTHYETGDLARQTTGILTGQSRVRRPEATGCIPRLCRLLCDAASMRGCCDCATRG